MSKSRNITGELWKSCTLRFRKRRTGDVLCFGKGLPKSGESNSPGNLPGVWSGRGKVVLKKQRVKEAQNENIWKHQPTQQDLLYKHEGTTGMAACLKWCCTCQCLPRPIWTKLGHVMNAELQSWSCFGGQPRTASQSSVARSSKASPSTSAHQIRKASDNTSCRSNRCLDALVAELYT